MQFTPGAAFAMPFHPHPTAPLHQLVCVVVQDDGIVVIPVLLNGLLLKGQRKVCAGRGLICTALFAAAGFPLRGVQGSHNEATCQGFPLPSTRFTFGLWSQLLTAGSSALCVASEATGV